MKRIHLVAMLLLLATVLVGYTIKRGPGVGANSVGSAEVVDGSLTAADLAEASVTASEMATNAVKLVALRSHPFSVTFCGLGPNNSAENFFSPISGVIPDGGDWSIGGTLCDANDGTTIGDEDEAEAGSGAFARTVKWMHCSFLDGTGGSEDDLITFVFYDATVATALSCTIQLDGVANTKTCTDKINAGEVVAAGAAITVGLDDVNDDLSAAGNDAWCRVAGILSD